MTGIPCSRRDSGGDSTAIWWGSIIPGTQQGRLCRRLSCWGSTRSKGGSTGDSIARGVYYLGEYNLGECNTRDTVREAPQETQLLGEHTARETPREAQLLGECSIRDRKGALRS